ncbi:hypothetical protein MKD38_06160 [Cupriavidus sp. WGlv3]|uniref:hypothetical protein n=1 Tax=Cupriavidus sp. WGlv3 TaxID=2919924 RepID=UPI002090F61A|nr:hypothetical protein [Cupriavidus sp. WGlv3]MCO4861247.1 hypothetical protein [Cupriavidus sp. WGlv3]
MTSNINESSTTMDVCFDILRKLRKRDVVAPTVEETKLIAANITDKEEGESLALGSREVAERLCKQKDRNLREAGIFLLKELSRHGDPYAKLAHAWLRWKKGPLKNHPHALELIDELLEYPWLEREWPYCQYVRAKVGEVYLLKGLLLFRGDKVKRNYGVALDHFYFAGFHCPSGEAAWLFAQFHAQNAKGDFAGKAKPQAALYQAAMARAEALGYVVETHVEGEEA